MSPPSNDHQYIYLFFLFWQQLNIVLRNFNVARQSLVKGALSRAGFKKQKPTRHIFIDRKLHFIVWFS